jgi:hypothetical protein
MRTVMTPTSRSAAHQRDHVQLELAYMRDNPYHPGAHPFRAAYEHHLRTFHGARGEVHRKMRGVPGYTGGVYTTNPGPAFAAHNLMHDRVLRGSSRRKGGHAATPHRHRH